MWRCNMLALAALLVLAPALLMAQNEDTRPYSNEELGVTLTLPGDDWQQTDHSQGRAKAIVFSPRQDLSIRCSILHMPNGFFPQGLLSREQQIKGVTGEAFQRVAYDDDVEFLHRKASRLEYTIHETRTVEWLLPDKEAVFIFQLSSTTPTWDTPTERAKLESIRDSLQFTGAAAKSSEAKKIAPTPAEIRGKRLANLQPEEDDFELKHHQLTVNVVPATGLLEVSDRMSIRSNIDQLQQLTLYYSVVTIDAVSLPEGATWKTRPRDAGPTEDSNVNELIISLPEPASRDELLTVEVQASCADFVHEMDQQLVAEVAVLGQVRPQSSYSSHVLYYPIDDRNDASMDITLTVPAGLDAVTGGELVDFKTRHGKSHFRYVTEDRRPRMLPFGFAVGKYIHRSAKSDGDLEVTIYGYAGEEPLLNQRVAAAMEAVNAFEKLMGQLPWKHVRVVHVTPHRKETGVSLPGLILISDAFFTDFTNVDMSDGNLENHNILSLLVLADELSHQWNAYSVPWPNELAEGISTFTNALFIEQRHGKPAFVNTIRYCRDAYFRSTAIGRDVAIADPDIYQTPAYRGIAFCKTAVALAMLRDLLGDEEFFAAWQVAFNTFDAKQDGFQAMESVFSASTGIDLSWFFNQWFYRPGWPKLELVFDQQDNQLSIEVQQVQDAPPYQLNLQLIVLGEANERQMHELPLTSSSTKVIVDCPFRVRRVMLDPNQNLLAEVVIGRDK